MLSERVLCRILVWLSGDQFAYMFYLALVLVLVSSFFQFYFARVFEFVCIFATCSFRVIAMSIICIIDIFCLLKKLFSGCKAAMHQFLSAHTQYLHVDGIGSALSMRIHVTEHGKMVFFVYCLHGIRPSAVAMQCAFQKQLLPIGLLILVISALAADWNTIWNANGRELSLKKLRSVIHSVFDHVREHFNINWQMMFRTWKISVLL